MKKIIIIMLVLVMMLPTYILAQEDKSIVLDTNPIDSNLNENGYVIYYDGNLTIDVDEDKIIEGTNGICVTGNLVITGDSTLTINVSEIGIKVGGTLKVTSPEVKVTGLSKAYECFTPIIDEAYVLNNDNTMAYFYNGTYYDYTFNNVLTNLSIKPKVYADLSKIDNTHTTLYKKIGDEVFTYPCVEGFIINNNEHVSTVTYNESLLTYYVNIWNDFDEDDISSNFIEFLFQKDEWGKTLDYEVIESLNFYKDIDLADPYTVTGERIPMPLVGVDLYSYQDDASSIDAISDFMLFVANGNNNKIVLKIYGKNDEYRYINLVVNKNEEEEPPTPPSDDRPHYQVVNTDVPQAFPSLGTDLSGEYILNNDMTVYESYTIGGDTIINLNGHTLTYESNGDPLFTVKADLIINGQEDNSSIVVDGNTQMIYCSKDKAISINKGTYSNIYSTCTEALIKSTKGTLNIKDSTLSSINNKGIVFKGTRLNIEDANITTKGNGVEINEINSEASFKNVDIASSSGSTFINSGKLTIQSGKYSFDPTSYVDAKYVIGQNTGEDRYTVGYTVTFDLDNGSDNKIFYVVENDKVTRIDDPTKEGYEFVSWYKDDIEYDFDSDVTESIALKAKYNQAEEPEEEEPSSKDNKKNYYNIVNTGVR